MLSDISSTISAAIVISLVDLNVGAIISNESSFGVTLNSRLVKILFTSSSSISKPRLLYK